MSRIGRGYLAGTSFVTVRAPRPGAGMERAALSLCRGTYAEVEVKARIPRMGAPSSKAV